MVTYICRCRHNSTLVACSLLTMFEVSQVKTSRDLRSDVLSLFLAHLDTWNIFIATQMGVWRCSSIEAGKTSPPRKILLYFDSYSGLK